MTGDDSLRTKPAPQKGGPLLASGVVDGGPGGLEVGHGTSATGARCQVVWHLHRARRLVEEAGFADVSVTYERVTSADRLDEAIQQAFVGSHDMRLVLGVKPM